jgi:capsular polysaccharide export protein
VIDPVGIYYDATAPSALEQILQTHPFPEPLLARAEHLIQRILALNLTKYNVGTNQWTPPATGRPLILVPGQVEFDASIRYGAQSVRTNLALLQAVRAAHPEAFLLYKPHPDVVAGLRARGPDETKALSCCDAVVTDVSMAELLNAVEQVHIMTSLTGFEALLRGKKVVCYGAPFYSGWGLTEDHAKIPRRGRTLSLQQLVAAALLLYPNYVHPKTNEKIEAEEALETLSSALRSIRVAQKRPLRLYLERILYRIVGFRNRLHDLKRAR